MDLAQFDGHTPGPWQCILNNPIAHGDVVTSEGDVVTRIRGWGWLQKLPDGAAQQDANGRLVAAAPDLLAEVRRLTAEAAELRRERDELAARLADAPVAIVDTRDALGLCAPTEEDFSGLYAMRGRRVALVPLDQRVSTADEPALAATPQQGESVQGPVRLTDERIAQLISQTWGSVDIAPQSAAAFARAIEARMLGASSPWSAALERAADLDADIIEAQRAVAQQLASRTTCDWPGECRHQRPASAAAPERAEPSDGCSDRVACPRGEQ